MGTGERDQRVAAFGRWLLQERELRGLARGEVVRLTKLAPGVVESLESGDPARMPPRAYLIGYLRAYASAVGLDADDAVLRWQEADGTEGEAAAPPPRRLPPRALLVGLALALVLALAVGTLVWSRRSRSLSLPERAGRQLERAPYQQR